MISIAPSVSSTATSPLRSSVPGYLTAPTLPIRSSPERWRRVGTIFGALSLHLNNALRRLKHPLSRLARPDRIQIRYRDRPSGGLFVCTVPQLTRSAGIQLNERVSLRRQLHALSFAHRIFPPSGPTVAKP